MMTNERLYFAYGSNLNLDDWHCWCAERGYPCDLLEPVCPAALPDHELIFGHDSTSRRGGVLDIRRSRGHIVRGMLFRARPDGWKALARTTLMQHVEARTEASREDRGHGPRWPRGYICR
jgi:hypothetical protein